ncbi:MAG: hypothetical protein HGA71_15525 [Azonexaceae bacterium]|nr:hypothetical protein [Azonexaceae bacterium]
MKTANIRALPALVVVEFPHGNEAVPTLVNGLPVRFATIDADGVVVAWSSLTPPELDNGAWCLDSDDLQAVGMVGADDGTVYRHAADSLRRITVNDMMVGA